MRRVRHHVSRAGGTIWPKDVVLPDEETRVCGGGRHHVDPEESPFGPKDVVPPDEGTRVCEG